MTDCGAGHPSCAFTASAEAGESVSRTADPGHRSDQKSVLHSLHRCVALVLALSKTILAPLRSSLLPHDFAPPQVGCCFCCSTSTRLSVCPCSGQTTLGISETWPKRWCSACSPPPPLTHFDTYLHTTYLLDISISPDFAFMQMLVFVMATMLVLAMAVSPLLLLYAPGDVVPHVHS